MVDLFVFAFVQLSHFPDAKRGARFRVYFEYQKTKAERRRHAMNSTTAPVWCKVPKFEIAKDSKRLQRGFPRFALCRCFSRDKGGAIPTGQGPSRPDREKAFDPPPDRAQKKEKRASRGQRPQTVREDNPLPTTNDDRRAAPCGHFASLVRSTFGLRGYPPIFDLRRIPQRRSYRGECRRANRSATLTAGLCEARAGWAGGEQYR